MTSPSDPRNAEDETMTDNVKGTSPLVIRGSAEALDEEWDRLVHKDDRTSPEDYPDHCLITREEVGEIIESARAAAFEEAAQMADVGMLVPPDGGSPNQDEIETASRIAAAIRWRALNPKQSEDF